MSVNRTDLKDFPPCPIPGRVTLEGRHARLEPYCSVSHMTDLFAAICGHGDAEDWRYIPRGMPQSSEELDSWLMAYNATGEWQTMVIRLKKDSSVAGCYSFMRLRPEHGSVEIGAVRYGNALKRTTAATEAFFLGAKHVFEDCNYRRYEWKCDNRNAASMRAASRYGFSYEGTFRQDLIVKGENRDTAWFSLIDTEWPECSAAIASWLAVENFDATGKQRNKLESLHSHFVSNAE